MSFFKEKKNALKVKCCDFLSFEKKKNQFMLLNLVVSIKTLNIQGKFVHMANFQEPK